MKKITLILIFIYSISIQGQVKLWNSKSSCKPLNTKGTFLLLDSDSSELKLKEKKKPKDGFEKGIFAATTLVGTALPFAFQYGNTALKNLTSKDEKDYSSEISSLNNVSIPVSVIDTSDVKFKATLFYYPKGKTAYQKASNYTFTIKKETNSFTISIDSISDIDEDYIPVKTKKNYDYILETFDISLHAVTKTEIDKKKEEEIKVELTSLGTTKITRNIASFRGNVSEVLNRGKIFFPKFTDSGKEVKIDKLIITCKITYLNPYGLTQSTLNKFLENNSDTNESLLNTIFVKPAPSE